MVVNSYDVLCLPQSLTTPEAKTMKNPKLEQKLAELPEVVAGKGVWQNKFHEYDVYDHTMDYVAHIKEMTSDPEIIVAGYLHNIGKPVVKTPKMKDGVIQEKEPGKPYHKFDDHELEGEVMVTAMDPQMFEEHNLNQNRIAKLVGAHYGPMKGIKELRKTTTYEAFLLKFYEIDHSLTQALVPKEEVLMMFLADKLAQGKHCTDKEELFAIRDALLGRGEDLKALYEMQRTEYKNKEPIPEYILEKMI